MRLRSHAPACLRFLAPMLIRGHATTRLHSHAHMR